MNYKKLTFVANWKMNLTSAAATELYKNNSDSFDALATKHDATIIACPPFTALTPLAAALKTSPLHLGAQNCSIHNPGAYTGEISAQDLAEIGSAYCIIGHSERRTLLHETDIDIAIKTEQLLAHNITPIICIGETQEEYDNGKTEEKLRTQLRLVFNIIKRYSDKKIYIAYEPLWAIGAHTTPDKNYLEKIFKWLIIFCDDNNTGNNNTFFFLYGGSVNEETITTLRTIIDIEGFLIGSASLDFQKFEKIVSLAYI
ncbi:MAG TPA: triose-phosphate isomerase [Candidatus Babeliales bacterium]|nr:triose-phosphate isomerase [Candidatus Babeliales bacterium]